VAGPSHSIAMEDELFARKRAGLLVPVFAMRHDRDFGIGDTRAVRNALDFCSRHSFDVLQILPIHDTFGDHSPYNPISSHALAPALLSLEPEDVPGLTRETVDRHAPPAWIEELRMGRVKQAAVRSLKLEILLAAASAFRKQNDRALLAEFDAFKQEQAHWLRSYSLYRVLIREYDGNPNWIEWRPEHRTLTGAENWVVQHHARERVEQFREGLAFVQWVAWRQWREVKRHAKDVGVRLMGEMSFGVGRCSEDVWAFQELFDLDWNMGTPPLAWFDTNKDSERWGQNWGFPPYRWENHRSSSFAWLRSRLRWEHTFFDACRLDHLRGYFRAYMFPWPGGSKHAEYANLSEDEVKVQTGGRLPRFVPGPDDNPISAGMNDLQGREIISVIREAAEGMSFVAEIMGAMPDYIAKALDDLAVPNLTFPQLERNADRSLRPPSKMRTLSLVSYANHDHAPLAMLYPHLRRDAMADPESFHATDLKHLLELIGWKDEPPEQLTDELLATFQRALFHLPCKLAVLMCSDLFGIPLRFNLPGSYGPDTWSERLDFPLDVYESHPEFGQKIRRVEEFIRESGRSEGID
jgi:4-alpha-glucanotransferase